MVKNSENIIVTFSTMSYKATVMYYLQLHECGTFTFDTFQRKRLCLSPCRKRHFLNSYFFFLGLCAKDLRTAEDPLDRCWRRCYRPLHNPNRRYCLCVVPGEAAEIRHGCLMVRFLLQGTSVYHL